MQQIYKITNTINNKIYIGKSRNFKRRFKRHVNNAKRRVNRHLYDAMNFYGYENFSVEMIEEVEDHLANEVEISYIVKYNSAHPNGYNMTSGGDGGNTLASWPECARKELYARRAMTRTGFRHTSESKELMSQIKKSAMAEMTPERREIFAAKVSKALLLKGITPPKEYWSKKGCEGFFKGKVHSIESREKISNARKGKSMAQILGSEQAADSFKDKQRIRFTGQNNPKHINITEHHIESLLAALCTGKIGLRQLSNSISLSEYKIRQWLRRNGIDNYQRMMYDKTDDEWMAFWRNVNVSRTL